MKWNSKITKGKAYRCYQTVKSAPRQKLKWRSKITNRKITQLLLNSKSHSWTETEMEKKNSKEKCMISRKSGATPCNDFEVEKHTSDY
jgi:hypothetical protein